MVSFVYGRKPVLSVLRNGAAKNCNVSGTLLAPVSFKFTQGAGSTYCLTGLSCLFSMTGTNTFATFGSLAALTNGVVIRATVAGATTTIATLKDNGDVMLTFPAKSLGTGVAGGFGNVQSIFTGYLNFPAPLILLSTDIVEVLIQDNLSTVPFLQFCAHGFTY